MKFCNCGTPIIFVPCDVTDIDYFHEHDHELDLIQQIIDMTQFRLFWPIIWKISEFMHTGVH